MSKEALIDRIISGDLSDGGDRVKYSDLKRGQVSQNDMNRINTNTVNNLANLPIYWYDKDDRDISTISFEIEKYVKTGKVGIVYIDYVQLIENSEIKGGMSNSLISSISIKLKKLQKRLGIPIILLSQLSRKCEERSGDERRPRIADIRESGQLEQDASTVIGLYREDYYAYLVDPNAQIDGWLGTQTLQMEYPKLLQMRVFNKDPKDDKKILNSAPELLFPMIWGNKRYVTSNGVLDNWNKENSSLRKSIFEIIVPYDPTKHPRDKWSYNFDTKKEWTSLANTVSISKSDEQVNQDTVKKNVDKKITQIQTEIKNALSK